MSRRTIFTWTQHSLRRREHTGATTGRRVSHQAVSLYGIDGVRMTLRTYTADDVVIVFQHVPYLRAMHDFSSSRCWPSRLARDPDARAYNVFLVRTRLALRSTDAIADGGRVSTRKRHTRCKHNRHGGRGEREKIK